MPEKKTIVNNDNATKPNANYDNLLILGGSLILIAGVAWVASSRFMPLLQADDNPSSTPAIDEPERPIYKEFEENAHLFPDDLKDYLQAVGLLREKKVVTQNHSEKSPSTDDTNNEFNLLYAMSALTLFLLGTIFGVYINHPKKETVLIKPPKKKKPAKKAVRIIEDHVYSTPQPAFFQPEPQLTEKTINTTDQRLETLNKQMSFLIKDPWFDLPHSNCYELKLHDSEYKGIPRQEIKQLIQALFVDYHIYLKHEHGTTLLIEKNNPDHEVVLPFNPRDAISLRKGLINKINPRKIVKDYDLSAQWVLDDHHQLQLQIQSQRPNDILLTKLMTYCENYSSEVNQHGNTINISMNYLKKPLPDLEIISFQENRDLKQKSKATSQAEPRNLPGLR